MSVRVAHRCSVVGLVAVVLAVATVLATAPVRAASCNGASHQVTLSSGSASPATGTTGTVVTFSVVYVSTAGCAPNVVVTVSGVGSLTMSGTGTNYAAGVTFQMSTTLPAGSHGYEFSATSGTGAGSQTVKLTSVSPAVVTIADPAPVVPPPAPVVPPPPPPPPQTAPPTPAPTAAPSLATSPSPVATTVSTSAPSADGWSGMLSGWGSRHGPAVPREPSVGIGAPLAMTLLREFSGMMLWLTATAGGLALLVFLSRRDRQDEGPVLDAVSAPARSTSVAMPRPYQQARRTGGEEQVARWLRPSVQAARYADPGRDGLGSDD